jgi:hypothetical protein
VDRPRVAAASGGGCVPEASPSRQHTRRQLTTTTTCVLDVLSMYLLFLFVIQFNPIQSISISLGINLNLKSNHHSHSFHHHFTSLITTILLDALGMSTIEFQRG